MAGLKKKHRWK